MYSDFSDYPELPIFIETDSEGSPKIPPGIVQENPAFELKFPDKGILLIVEDFEF